jgi:hypothetical protein
MRNRIHQIESTLRQMDDYTIFVSCNMDVFHSFLFSRKGTQRGDPLQAPKTTSV